MKGWADKITQIKEDQKSLKIGRVAANNHYGVSDLGQSICLEMVDMNPIIFGNIDLKDIDSQLGL